MSRPRSAPPLRFDPLIMQHVAVEGLFHRYARPPHRHFCVCGVVARVYQSLCGTGRPWAALIRRFANCGCIGGDAVKLTQYLDITQPYITGRGSPSHCCMKQIRSTVCRRTEGRLLNRLGGAPPRALPVFPRQHSLPFFEYPAPADAFLPVAALILEVCEAKLLRQGKIQ